MALKEHLCNAQAETARPAYDTASGDKIGSIAADDPDAIHLRREKCKQRLLYILDRERSLAARRFAQLNELYDLVRNAPADYAEFHEKLGRW